MKQVALRVDMKFAPGGSEVASRCAQELLQLIDVLAKEIDLCQQYAFVQRNSCINKHYRLINARHRQKICFFTKLKSVVAIRVRDVRVSKRQDRLALAER